MRELETDVAILGAGTAGLNARSAVERAGKRWLLIDGGPYGTTCARVGCMPSKLLIAAAERAHHIQTAGRLGLEVTEQPRYNTAKVLDRVRRERDRFVASVVRSVEKLPSELRIHGQAKFEGPTSLLVDDHTRIRAKAFVIATGSRPYLPPVLNPVRDRVMTSDDLFELDALPDSIAVIGTGVIGLELGQALHRLGVRTVFFDRSDGLGPITDPKVRAAVHTVLGQELTLHLQSELVEVSRSEDRLRISFRTSDGNHQEEQIACILAAAGRKPNVDGLHLEAAGLVLDHAGRTPWDPFTTQCGASPIFLAGDASGHQAVLHEAADEGRIAGDNAARYPEVKRQPRRTRLLITFTDPQMALVGARYADLEPDQIQIGEVSFGDQGRARVLGENRGIGRLYARPGECTLLGAELFGPRAEHLAHLLAWSAQQGLRITEMLRMPFYHPVIEEGLRTALKDLVSKLGLTGGCPPQDLAASPGA